MNATVENTDMSKLDWAKQSLARELIPYASEGLALRILGGGCGQPGSLAVPFGANHGDDVTKAVENLPQGQGDSDLSTAVNKAIDDFTNLPSDTVKQVIVYVGTLDQCGMTDQPAKESAEAIRSFMQDKGVKAQFKFIPVGLSSTERQQLQEFRSVLPSLQAVVPPSGPSGPDGAS